MNKDAPVGINELPPPPEAYTAANCGEILRAWVVDGGLSVSLAPMSFGKEPYLWGMALVDIARHVARAFENEGVESFDETLVKIRLMFDREWSRPTDMGKTEKTGRQ
jgi:hypothetical protein